MTRGEGEYDCEHERIWSALRHSALRLRHRGAVFGARGPVGCGRAEGGQEGVELGFVDVRGGLAESVSHLGQQRLDVLAGRGGGQRGKDGLKGKRPS
jgi:hypothetical protein